MPIFCFRHRPTGFTQKVKSDERQKALTRIVSQFWTGTKRRDWEYVWKDSEERVYGYAQPNYWPKNLRTPKGYSVKFQQRITS